MRTLFILMILTSAAATTFSQGIRGKVVWLSGNQMPGPGRATPPGLGIKREIIIHKATTLRDTEQGNDGRFYKAIHTEFITKITTKKDGSFKVKLPPGEYSLFTKEPNGLYANLFDGKGRINLVEVEPGHYSSITITVDYEAAY